MTSNKSNPWFDEKWAIAFFSYILVLLLIFIGAYLQLIPTELAFLPNYDILGHFLLMGIASYLSYLALRQRTLRIGCYGFPLGPLLVSLLVLIDETLQGLSLYRTVSLADMAASLSGIVLFYRLAKAQAMARGC